MFLFDDTLFRGELKSDPFWINKKSNAAILSKRHQGVRGWQFGEFFIFLQDILTLFSLSYSVSRDL